MLQVFLLVAGLIYSIYGSYVCPPAPTFDPSCIARLIKPGCTSDEDCTKYGTKCCKSDCNVLQCLESVQGIVKVGICPPLPIVKPDFCITAKFSSDCEGNDANCPGQKKCCPTLCGSRNCRDPITEPRKECPAVPVPGPQCFRFDQQCSSDLDCPKSQICCGVICGIGCRDPVVSYLPPAPVSLPREGVCPPPEVVSQDFCNRADVRSDCTAVGRDSECRLAGYKCCPGVCGSLLCQAALTDDRPGCPPINPNLRCITYNQQCNTDDDCGKGKKCCYQPACGTSCYAPDPNCPPYRKDVICKRFDKQCTTNADCKEGDICCSVECGTACKRPYRPPYENPPCQPVLCDLFCEFGFAKDENGCEICRCIQKTCPPRSALCILIPPGACTKDNFLIIDGGVKCPLCPSIIPCNKDCLLPVQPGPCKGSFKRYFYDVDLNSCKEFVYGGCQGNNNNFNSLQECEEKCNTKPKGPICPPVCAIFCQFGNVLDSNGCPTCKCKDNPCPPDPLCPRPPQGPPGTCRPPCVFEYEEIDGVRCKVKCGLGPVPPIGPPGVPCPPTNCPIQGPIEPPQPPTGLCVNGNPLPNFFCGRGPSHQECPTGYSCNVDPADRFAVCCPDSICPNGNPLPNIFCGRGPSHQDCPSGYSCNIDPGDAFAVCCPDKKKYGSCPPIKPGTVGPCVELCSGDDSCPGKEKCCSNGCGHACTNPIGEHTCPFVKCAFCEHGYEMDDYGCQTCKCKPDPCPSPVCPPPPEGSCTENYYRIINGVKCPWCPKIVPCKPKDCPIPDCAQPPPLSCTEPDFRIFEGVKCPWCPKIVPCKANCDAGMPLPDINCGLRPDRQNCPAGFFCNVDPIDRFAVCCPDCDRGKPLSNVRCDDVNRKCPSGYRCKKIHGICCQDCPLIKCSNQCEFGFLNDRNGCPTCDCKPSPCLLPPCARPPPDACTEPQYKIIDGVRCPWCYKIVPCKDKVCPTVPADSICYEYTRDCQDDSSCTDGRKCCRQGCSYVCVNPI